VNSGANCQENHAHLPSTSIAYSNGMSHYKGSNYLTIIQDPYPPLNNSPDFFDNSSYTIANDMNAETMPSIIDCIEMEDFGLSFEQNAAAENLKNK
jgi:hypothetical protein